VWRMLFGDAEFEAMLEVVGYELSVARGSLGDVPRTHASIAVFALKLVGEEAGATDARILAIGVPPAAMVLERGFAELRRRASQG